MSLRRRLAHTRTRVRDVRSVPDDVTAVLAAAPDERLLTWARERDGSPIVATTRGVWAYGDRLAWIEIDHVAWSDGVLTILAIDGERRTLRVALPRDLPAVVRSEVDASVITSRAVPLRPDGRGVTIVARRDGLGETHWRVRYDPGVESGPESRATVDEALTALRIELGI